MSSTSVSAAAPPIAVLLVGCLAIFLLTAMDAVMKGLVLAIGVYNTMLWRSMLATVAAGTVWSTGRRKLPNRPNLTLHGLRAVVIAATTLFFFWGLARLPLAEAIALSFIAPLIALYMAAVLLGERIGKSAIWGSVAGMAGVVVIMVGKAGHAEWSRDAVLGTGAILVSAIFYAYNLILARKQAQIASALEIAFFQNLALAITLALAAPWLGRLLPQDQWAHAALATALNLSGLVLLTWAYARAEAQYLIPIEYTAFVWAILLGWAVFGETVEWTTIAGAGMIIAGCLIVAMTKPKLAEPVEPAGV